MIGYLVVSLMPIIGVIAGLARVFSPRVPFIAAGLVVALYVLYLATAGIWAGTCSDCFYYETSRADTFQIGAFVLGFMAVSTLLGIWLGARLVTVVGRLRRTWREIRGEPDPPAADGRSV